MAQGDIFKLAIVGRVGQDDVIVTHHYRQDSEYTGVNSPQFELASKWVNTVKDEWLALTYGGYALDFVTVKNISEDSDEVTVTVDENGAQSGEGMPNFVAPIVSLRTGFAGRSNRGRNYLPPPSEGNCQGNNIVTAMFNSIQAYYDDAIKFIIPTTGPEFNMVVYSKKNNSAKTITSVIIRTALGSQRRRKAGKGS